MAKDFTHDFTEGPITGPLIRFGFPLFMANLLQIVYNMVDMMVVGNVCGKAGLSAVTVGGSVTDFFTVLVMGFSSAAQIIISQFIGAKRRDRIGSFIGTFAITLLCGAAINTAVALILRRHLLMWMNTPPEAFEQALSYSVMSMSGIVFVFGYNAVSAIMRGLGDAKRPFIFIAIAAVTNAVLDVVFVAGLHMQAFGAALATVMAQAISFIIAIIYLVKNRSRLGFEFHKSDIRFEKELFLTLVKLGIPMALKSAAVSFSRLFTNSFVNSYGVEVAAVTGIGSKINQIGNLVSNSLNTAGSSMVGQNIGAQKYKRVPKIMLSVWVINISLTLVLVAVMILFPQWVFSLFTKDMSIMGVAMEFVPIAVIMLMASALRSGANALINGSGNFAVNLTVALLDALILRISLGLLFGLVMGYGYRGFWLGDALSGMTPFFIAVVFYFTGKWKTRKHIVKDET